MNATIFLDSLFKNMQLSNYALLRLRFEEDFMNVLYKYVLYIERGIDMFSYIDYGVIF